MFLQVQTEWYSDNYICKRNGRKTYIQDPLQAGVGADSESWSRSDTDSLISW